MRMEVSVRPASAVVSPLLPEPFLLFILEMPEFEQKLNVLMCECEILQYKFYSTPFQVVLGNTQLAGLVQGLPNLIRKYE